MSISTRDATIAARSFEKLRWMVGPLPIMLMVMTTSTSTEPLTDQMIADLRSEAGAHGDEDIVDSCDNALHGALFVRKHGRAKCAQVINEARSMDDSKPYVEVVP